MRLLIQRVRQAKVVIAEKEFSSIGKGLLVLVGIEEADSQEDIDWLVGKLCRLRIFDDEQGVMNLDVQQIEGDVMVVSQFTLHASTKKGNRPSYFRAAPEAISRPMYEKFVASCQQALGKEVATGSFGADMQVELVNDGPVTIWIDSKNKE
ncbi:MAG: D-tyrosyl-tRNA(Tyr) deacylase [Alistipes sp.]|nr:D-tyrosyl-tRNA(Tyr) deacylase [Alistipes sp.]MBQ8779555.1 D-tyrosyl-tRNA(Tyr) deacylase [Alistipes sp.]